MTILKFNDYFKVHCKFLFNVLYCKKKQNIGTYRLGRDSLSG